MSGNRPIVQGLADDGQASRRGLGGVQTQLGASGATRLQVAESLTLLRRARVVLQATQIQLASIQNLLEAQEQLYREYGWRLVNGEGGAAAEDRPGPGVP